MSFDKLVDAFAGGGIVGLALLALLIIIIILIRALTTQSRQTIAALGMVAEASKVDAEANKALAVALGRIESKLEYWPPRSPTAMNP